MPSANRRIGPHVQVGERKVNDMQIANHAGVNILWDADPPIGGRHDILHKTNHNIK